MTIHCALALFLLGCAANKNTRQTDAAAAPLDDQGAQIWSGVTEADSDAVQIYLESMSNRGSKAARIHGLRVKMVRDCPPPLSPSSCHVGDLSEDLQQVRSSERSYTLRLWLTRPGAAFKPQSKCMVRDMGVPWPAGPIACGDGSLEVRTEHGVPVSVTYSDDRRELRAELARADPIALAFNLHTSHDLATTERVGAMRDTFSDLGVAEDSIPVLEAVAIRDLTHHFGAYGVSSEERIRGMTATTRRALVGGPRSVPAGFSPVPPAEAVQLDEGVSCLTTGVADSRERPQSGDIVMLAYHAWSEDGTELARTLAVSPRRSAIDSMLPGWQVAMKSLTPGGEARCWIPDAYGGAQDWPVGMLTIDVEVVGIERGLQAPPGQPPSDAEVTPEGRFIQRVHPGIGERPSPEATVVFETVAWSTRGRFHTTDFGSDEPREAVISDLPALWTEALTGMTAGEAVFLWDPKDGQLDHQWARVYEVRLLSVSEP